MLRHGKTLFPGFLDGYMELSKAPKSGEDRFSPKGMWDGGKEGGTTKGYAHVTHLQVTKGFYEL